MDALDPALGLDPAALEALAQGRHGDPFAVLGPHTVDGTRVIRAIAPGANGIEVVAAEDGTALGRLNKVHPSGVFAGRVGPGPYRLRILWEETIQETEDPYTFGLLLGPLDLHLISQGTHYELGQCLGARPMTIDGVRGVRFAVWAPNARRVSVVGDFNTWDGRRHPMRLRQEAGVWELFVPRLGPGERYKFELIGPDGSLLPQKADPVARASEAAPATASIVAPVEPFPWTDAAWMAERPRRQGLDQPMAIYEVHAGSWFRAEDGGFLDWNALGDRLIPYVRDMGFTHLELMPIMEHPFGGSWGYQPLGLFAPTGRFGPPDDFAAFVDRCHAAEIGIILDWVPAHFPTDVYGLARFDGTALYEHEDPREGFHQDWNTLIYNLGRNEVRGFLIASAFEWLERYHVDGIRVDAVASMLYRDYSRAADAWIPNIYGGRENLEAVEFFKHLNSMIPERCPGALTIAEESTAWPKVTAPASEGGLGFTLKWNMGWMHDTLGYMELDPIFRRWHHHALTFGMIYAYSEHFVLPLSHDEVVYGKGSLIRKMPGDDWQKFANLRAYLSFMWSFPGRKLIFMGGEIAQWAEWNHDSAIHWDLLDKPAHKGVQRAMRDLNRLYRRERPLHARDDAPDGFQWVVADDSDASVYAFLRSAPDEAPVLVVANLTPLPRQGYRIGVPHGGWWEEIFNSDAEIYGGSNLGNGGGVEARDAERHGQPFSVDLALPPLATIMLRARGG